MLHEAAHLLEAADGILYLVPATEPRVPVLASLLPDGVSTLPPTLIVRTKADLVEPGDQPVDGLVVSARSGTGLDAVLRWCGDQARPGPFRYDADDLSTQPTRFFVAEFVREAAFACLGEELPYALATEVDEFREGSTPLYIRVIIFIERDSQKGMVVGQGGRMIKRIGSLARQRIEAFVGEPVYLDLWSRPCPSGARSRRPSAGSAFTCLRRRRHEPRAGAARHPGVPQVQGGAELPAGTDGGTRVSRLPAPLRRGGRDPHHADR